MKRASYLWLWLLVSVWPLSGVTGDFPSDDYGPACQWVRLIGEVERPESLAGDSPLLLTVTYRLPDQKTPITLLTNYPIEKSRFLFILSGFRSNIQGALFVPPKFFFSEKVEFQYFVTSGNHKLATPLKQSVYRPERIKRDGKVFCQTAIHLEKLSLSPR
ncbi:MAG: hypothetical protein K8R69_09820 [Deltaproteobacteria bacterium]|nr:hypothetical protein [Deltaproteobacteria bacterium]